MNDMYFEFSSDEDDQNATTEKGKLNSSENVDNILNCS